MCSKAINYILKVVNPTINVQAVDVARIPLPLSAEDLKNHIIDKVDECLLCSQQDWDAYETSWDFKRHPLI